MQQHHHGRRQRASMAAVTAGAPVVARSDVPACHLIAIRMRTKHSGDGCCVTQGRQHARSYGCHTREQATDALGCTLTTAASTGSPHLHAACPVYWADRNSSSQRRITVKIPAAPSSVCEVNESCGRDVAQTVAPPSGPMSGGQGVRGGDATAAMHALRCARCDTRPRQPGNRDSIASRAAVVPLRQCVCMIMIDYD